MNKNVKIAKELTKLARELVAGSAYDNAAAFQKAIQKPTPQNVNKFMKSLPVSKPAPSKKNANDMDEVVASLCALAKELMSDEDK